MTRGAGILLRKMSPLIPKAYICYVATTDPRHTNRLRVSQSVPKCPKVSYVWSGTPAPFSDSDYPEVEEDIPSASYCHEDEVDEDSGTDPGEEAGAGVRGGPEVNLTSTSTTHAFISPPTLVPRDPKRAPLSPPQFTSATLPPSIIFHVSRRLRNREHRAMHGNIPTPPPNPNPPERPRLKRGAPLAPVRHTRQREGGIEGRGWGERGGPASGGGGGEGQATGEWDASNEDWPPLTPSSLPSPHLPPSSPGQGTRTPHPPPPPLTSRTRGRTSGARAE